MKTVNILLSTYNGQAFLNDLVASIGAQRRARLIVQVRDDGSTDQTPYLLKRLINSGLIDQVEFGRNMGAARSFFRLLETAASRAHFFAFADQDDLWKSDKIESAVNALQGLPEEIPALYCGRLEFIDQGGRILGRSPVPSRGMSFANALAENMAAGCTIVMNRAARSLILECLPDRCIMHDWWCYLVISAFGRIVYDKRVHISYRLHSRNTIGTPLTLLESLTRRAKRFMRQGSDAFKSHSQAVAFSRCFGYRLPSASKRMLDAYIGARESLGGRCRYAWRKDAYRQSRLDDLILRILICLGCY
jgi:glycosyltransferase involved in cell wall biosynthesis